MARGRKTSLMIDLYLGGTADAPGVGTFDHHSCWACQTRADYFTRG